MKRLASGSSSLTTFVQVAPRLLSLVGRMRPTWHVSSLAAVTPAFLRGNGIGGVIWDVDGTLTGDRRRELVPESEAPLRALLAAPDLRHVVLSNASEPRFVELGEMFPEVPILRGYALRGALLFRKLYRGVDTWSPEDVARRLAEGAHVVRKPSAELVDYAVSELGCERSGAVMVGDQYLTDVAGANLGGVRSIKLPTLAPETFRSGVRLSQLAEGLLYSVVHGGEGSGAVG